MIFSRDAGDRSQRRLELGKVLDHPRPARNAAEDVADFRCGRPTRSSPGRGDDPRSGLVFRPDGTITVEPPFRSLEDAWYQGLASMARHGMPLILDEVLLAGGVGQQRLRVALEGLDVLWVGVRCDPAVAAAREAGRRTVSRVWR